MAPLLGFTFFRYLTVKLWVKDKNFFFSYREYILIKKAENT